MISLRGCRVSVLDSMKQEDERTLARLESRIVEERAKMAAAYRNVTTLQDQAIKVAASISSLENQIAIESFQEAA